MLLLDAPTRVGGQDAFRDHLDPRVLHVLPGPPRVVGLRLGEAVELEVEAGPTETPPEPTVPLTVDRLQVALVRFEAQPSPRTRRPVVVVRTLLRATVDGLLHGAVLLRGRVSDADRSELQRMASGGPGRLAVVSRLVFTGLEPPASAHLRADLRAARRYLAERLEPDAQQVLDRSWWRGLPETGAVELAEGEPSEAFAERCLRAGLFEPEPGPDVLGEPALGLDPALHLAWSSGNRPRLGHRLRPESALPEGTVELDGRRGLVREEQAVVAAPFDARSGGLADSGAVFAVHPGSSWSGIEALELEHRSPDGTVQTGRLSSETTRIQLPAAPKAEFRARARLSDGDHVVLERPEWTGWMPSRFGRGLDPQTVAGRRERRITLGWIDPSRVRGAKVRLTGAEGAAAASVDGAAPEAALSTVGAIHRVVVEIGLAEGSTRMELAPPRGAVLAVPPPTEVEDPVLIRLVDPLRRYERVTVHVASGGDRRQFVLSRFAPEALWSPSSPGDYRVRLEAKLGDGRVTREAWRTGDESLLRVGDPSIELRPVVVEAGTRRLWLILEAEPSPPAPGSAVETYVEPGERVIVELPTVEGTPLAYRLFGEAYDLTGGSERIEPQLIRADRWTDRPG